MYRFAYQRPIAILTSFAIVLAFSVVALRQLPISLLPDIEVPQIVIKVQYPNASPAEIEQNVLRPIRDGLQTLGHLQNIESKAFSQQGEVLLYFEYGTKMDLAYIEANEKVDQLIDRLPKGLRRPQVVKINTSDIPIVRLQITPKHQKNHLQLSYFAEKVIKKRLETIEGISIVDINGTSHKAVFVTPHPEKLQSLGIPEGAIAQAIQNNNKDLGTISIKEGQYRYYLKLTSKLQSIEDIQKLQIRSPNNQLVPLSELVTIQDTIEQKQGYHLNGKKEGVVITIHKQAKARMPELMKEINEQVTLFSEEYPNMVFELTQDQSSLLDASISNLKGDLIFGGFFAFLMLFFFIGNYKVPFLIGVILPSSLLMSFLIFYVFGTSLNIISLSGLALGLGMTIDNAIIIFDNIGKKRLEGMTLLDACVKGTVEMTPPLISSALTTQAVFIPLVFLDDLSGALSYDQAVAVGAILFTSLIISFFLLPLLYILLFKHSDAMPKEDNRPYKMVLKAYKKLYQWIFVRRNVVFPVLLFFGILGLGISAFLGVEGLPTIHRDDLLCQIDWEEPISVQENKKRVEEILSHFDKEYQSAEADIGIQQFVMQSKNTALDHVDLYLKMKSVPKKNKVSRSLDSYIRVHYPQATVSIKDASNTFDLLFDQKKPFFELRWQNQNTQNVIPSRSLNAFKDFGNKYQLEKGEGMQLQSQVELSIDLQKLNTYSVPYTTFLQKLKQLLNQEEITEIRNFSDQYHIRFAYAGQEFGHKINSSFIQIDSTHTYPVGTFVHHKINTAYKTLTADKSGIYHSMQSHSDIKDKDIDQIKKEAHKIAQANDWQSKTSGRYVDQRKQMMQLGLILLISIMLLYFILVIEFESFRQPLIVLLTLPFGFSGSFLLLFLSGQSLNIMSAIGLVVMLGIIDNESILKIDTINRLRQKEHMSFEEAIAKAGEVTFKPILMTSLTNVLALLPFLFDSGIGADLQKPFVIAIIGGLSIGTFTAIYFVPLMYYFIMKNVPLKKEK